MERQIPMAAVVRLAFEPAWLGLERIERHKWSDLVAKICAAHPKVEFSWFDADALGHGYSDFAICRFNELAEYHFLWEELRDTELFSRPYLRIVDVTLGLERGYEAYEAEAATTR